MFEIDIRPVSDSWREHREQSLRLSCFAAFVPCRLTPGAGVAIGRFPLAI